MGFLSTNGQLSRCPPSHFTRPVVRDTGAITLNRLPPARPLCSLTAPAPFLRSAAPAAKARSLPGRASAMEAAGSAELPGPDPVAVYLEQHGISAAQLQQEQPQAYAQLTLPLAQLLVALLAARVTRANTLGPADLAARLSFLSSEVGLPPQDIQRIYGGQPGNLQFDVERGQAALRWLRRQSLSAAFCQKIVAKRPLVWSMRVETLQATKAAFMQLFGLSDADWVALVSTRPLLVVSPPRTARSVVAWLRSDAVGLSAEGVVRLVHLNPSLFAGKVATLSSKLEFLAGLLAVPREEWGLVLSRASKSLETSCDSLANRVHALQSYGFTQEGIRTLLLGSTCGYMVVSANTEKVILPTLAILEELLGGDKQAVMQACLKSKSLIMSRPAKLQQNFQVLLNYGLTGKQAQQLLVDTPQVYKMQLDGPEVEAKLRYYQEVLGISPLQMLLLKRGYLKEGLAKVDQRVFWLERSGQLQDRVQHGSLVWTCLSLARFCQEYEISKVEWEACVAQWPESERAQRYGLMGLTNRSGNDVFKQRGRRRTARVAGEGKNT